MLFRVFLSALSVLLGAGFGHAQDRRPNFVVVLADDLGYGDLACYGDQEVKTPNLDAFAKKGLKLTSCYAAHANCSPSRAGLMTGRTPTRVGITNWIPFLSPMHLREQEVTVATLLRNSGYSTCHVGKWHLNGWFNLPGQPQPDGHGFDHWFSTQNNALPSHRNPHNFVRNNIPVGPQRGYSSELVVDEAVAWLESGRDRTKPFFLFVCFHEPHEPIATDKKYTDLYPYDDPSKSAHHGNITQMDHAFGRLMAALERMGLDGNTLILFTSDNGPAITNVHPHGSAGPLRAKKGHMYEGGIRVPGIVYWAGHTRAGSVSDEPVCGTDVLPTFCAAAGIEPPRDRVIDGASFLPVLAGDKIERRRPLYWHFNGASSDVKVVLREGDYTLLATLTGPTKEQAGDIRPEDIESLRKAELAIFELYNVRKDIGQKVNLVKAEPEQFRAMADRMKQLYREVRAESPAWPEWTWPRWENQFAERPEYAQKPKQAPRRRAAAAAGDDGWKDLFPGKDLQGWKRVPLAPDTALNAKNPWTVDPQKKLLLCDGNGVKEMLLYNTPLQDGTFHVEWRFRPVEGEKFGYNSGVYVRSADDGKVWVQVQTAVLDKAPMAGDIFGDLPTGGELKRVVVEGAGHKYVRPPGEWNTFDITCRGKSITVNLNDTEVTTWSDCPRRSGHFGLQSEFYFIEFRNLKWKAE